MPFDKAPPLKTSNFDQIKSMNVLDAKTHNFTGAWNAGFTGTGVTASVLDGGTDWGHPDLIGTWQTWTSGRRREPRRRPGLGRLAEGVRPVQHARAAGGARLHPAGPVLVHGHAGGDVHLHREERQAGRKNDKDTLCQVTFATQTGPARNFSAPAGTNTHTYTFPASWSKSGTVKLTSHPDEYLLELYGERPAVLVTDPNTAGQYDTVVRRPERRLRLHGREAGHEELAGLLPRPER